MSPASETFVLRSTVTSPFGRKVRMAIDILGLTARVSLVPANTLDPSDTLRLQNPLGKLPCLLRVDGAAIYDSRVIIEFLQEVAGGKPLLPAGGLERYQTLTLATLADGIVDAALLMVYEGRFHEPGTYSERWLEHQREKIVRALATFERDPPDARGLRLVAIGLSCALGYLDWRKPLAWRQDHPRLVEWLADFSNAEPAYLRTRAPDQ
jgi:glutathione S-transferase